MSDHPTPRPSNINILTLNCWGLKYLAKHRRERLDEIGRQIALADPVPDIVGLQECWVHADYRAIREHCRTILPHGKFYHSGIFGGGLAILSRWPLEESSMFQYPLNGRPTAFFRGDWFVGKGVACAKIRYGPTDKDVAEVFCTHLHAPYEREPNDSYICHRTAQAWEISKLMRGAHARGHLVIGLGDFNMLPLSLAHRLISTHGRVTDVWRALVPDSSLGAAIDEVEQKRGLPVPSASHNLAVNGATCDSVLNTWRWNKAHQKRLARGEDITVDPKTTDPRAKRLDYIFFAAGESHDAAWAVTRAHVGMTDRHPSLRCSLSDHFSVEATISCTASSGIDPEKAPPPEPSLAIEPPVSPRASESGQGISAAPARPSAALLPPATYTAILALVSAYTRRQRRQRRLFLSLFLASVPLCIACLVGLWFGPVRRTVYAPFLLALGSTLGLAAGVLVGLIGGLFVGAELRALKEFEWEMRNARRASRRAAAEAAGPGKEGVDGEDSEGEEAVRDWYDE